ncbi:hypothetical protein CYMTET_53383 [Cymbomonas tetramitiformis]|uniref:Uncharacterized protein n=1 Tax=Cymbomonas tetramitiformis TaxID=36881 RepID=A0AAE0EQ48_9CHLO|nr:hypothetical protein CYMTET_53383 [Cymbomonas tetramitiformis]
MFFNSVWSEEIKLFMVKSDLAMNDPLNHHHQVMRSDIEPACLRLEPPPSSKGRRPPPVQQSSLAKRAMRNPAQGGCLADREPIKPSNAQEGTSLKPPPNIKLIFPEGWSTAEGFRDPEYETITKKERLLAWIAPPHLPISTRELELSARDAGEAPPEAYEAQSKESPPPPNAEAPTSPPLAGGSARDAGEAPPEAYEAQSKESPPPPNAEAPTSPPLAGGSARDAGEAPPEAYEAHEGHALDGTIGSSMPDLRASSMSTSSSSISKSFSRDAGEAPREAHEAANSAGLDDGRYYFGIPGFIDVVIVDAERSPHQFPLDVTPEGDNLPSNAEEAYDFFEAHQAILTPIRMETVVYLVHDGNFEATTYGSLLPDDSQLDNPTRDNVREVRCLGRHWRSVSTINDWPDLIRAVGVWSLIAVTTDAMAAEMEEPMRSPVEEPAEAKDTEMGEVKDTAGEADPWLSLHAMHRRNVGTVTLERGRFLCDCTMCYGVDLRGNVVSKATRTRHRKLHGQIQPPATDPEEIDAVVHTNVDVTMDDKEGEHAEEAGRTSAEGEVVHAQQDVEAKDVSSQGGEAGVPDDEDGDAPKTEDADGETKDGGGEDLGFDEEDDGDAVHSVKAAIATQLESIVNADHALEPRKSYCRPCPAGFDGGPRSRHRGHYLRGQGQAIGANVLGD